MKGGSPIFIDASSKTLLMQYKCCYANLIGRSCIIILFNHVGRFCNPRICQVYSAGGSMKMRLFGYYSHIQTKLGNLGGVKLPILSTRNNVIIGKFVEIRIHSINITEHICIVHNILTIQTGTIHYSYQHQFLKFLLTKVR